jgi:gliding motility-associated-like protein
MRKFYSTLKHFVLFIVGVFCIASLTAQECNIIYVAPSGVSTGVAGTRANPASLTYGLTLVTSTTNVLWLAKGTYPISTSLVIPNNVTIEGGFDATTWIKSNVSQSIIDKDNTNVLPSPFNALVGIAGNGVSNFRLQDISVNVANAPGQSNSVYGIYLNGCSNYNVVRCTVTTGTGSSGIAGLQGGPAVSGSNGNPGISGNPNGISHPGGTGGFGSNGTNNGGTGASSGVWNGSVVPGLGGLPSGCGGTGGTTGSGPSCSPFCGSCTDATPGTAGTAGQDGAIGTIGAVGPTGIFTAGYFIPGTAGTSGGQGMPGCGGGGGGGGGGDQQSGPDGMGGSGGGGGGGGAGSNGGTGGKGGGGSFAIFLYNNSTGGTIQDCFLNPGAGGAGGLGGTGGPAGAGGTGGAGGAGDCPQENGGAGGNGGNGGIGGAGGAGAVGLSLALSEHGGTPVTNSGITVVPGNPPVISVTNRGCVNSEVIFSSATSGTWNFGAGASPLTATGTGPFSVYYPTLGRKSITFNGTIFSDYVGIFQASSPNPSIVPANSSVTLGCPYSFTAALTGSYYKWIFGNEATPDSIEGATMQTVSNIYFNSPGTFTIYVFVTTNCCGKVRDSTTVTVTPSSFNVSLTAAPSPSCVGAPITFTASPSTYLNYIFSVDGAVAQNGASNVFTSSTLAVGDSVEVMAIAGTCYTNPSAELVPVIIPIPIVTLSSSDADSTICSGQSISFTAAPLGYTNYEFFDGATSVQSSNSAIYTTTTLQAGNSITVVATNSGCVSLPSNAKATTINPTPVVTLTSSDSDNILCGTGQSVTFTASPAGVANYDFFVGTSNVKSGVNNTFTTTTLALGSDTVSAIATSSLGCISSPISIVTSVNPIPTVSLTSSDANDTICQNALITFAATPAGNNSYEFFNAGASVQNSPSNSYTTSLNAGNSISVVATNLGCTSPPSDTIVVYILPASPVNAGVDFAVCINAPSITLTGFTPANGVWTGTGITSPNGTFDPTTAGSGIHPLLYSFTNTNGCTGYDTLLATVNPLPVLSIFPALPTLCAGIPVALTASGATSYSWSPAIGLSSTNGSNISANPAITTTYTIVGTSNNCVDSISTTVVVNPLPTVAITGTTSISACESATLTASTTLTGTYSWGPLINLMCNTCQTVTVAPTATQNYYVLFTTPAGCSATDTVKVTLVNIFSYFMPTAFSPNDDGINDTLHVHGKGIESISLQIFDRVGEKVFESTNIKDGWDGSWRGVPMNDGIFVYVLEVKYCNGKSAKEQGNLTLLK